MSASISFDSSVYATNSMCSEPPSLTKGKSVRIKKPKKSVTTSTLPETESLPEEIATPILNEVESNILSHLGTYTEEPFQLIETYFRGQHLERLVRHQIESYNHFINYQIQRTIQMFNPVIVHSENDYVTEHDKYMLEVEISFTNFKIYPPQIHENNGATKVMLPEEAKLRNFTYASTMAVDVNIKYTIRNTESMDTPRIVQRVLPKINIGKMPIMLKSSICVLNQNRHIHPSLTGECSMDCGGYFIVKGSEKTVLGQERAAENRVYVFDGKNTTKWTWYAEIKSIPDYKCISPKQIEMMIASKNNGFGYGLYIQIPRIKQPIELFVLFRALGIMTDKEICEYIVLDVDDDKQVELAACLQASIIDANKYMTEESALQHITSYAAYTPINMDRETGAQKKREFTIEVLTNDLYPHCRTKPQKLHMLGYMAKKLLQTSLGWLPASDRDSYLNKRIELTGTLLNNLFRNYFNKLVKEMQKQVVREINGGSWRSSEDYENIINMTNIYKIMKSMTIENGIARALSTGDFSIKQANSSKVGVAQVLNRLTYVSSLSHLRRINTPLEKSGELIAPRKLHNTTWGFLCPAETPEGQSIGIVKNISYLAHLTIPTNSASLYEYILPNITSVDDCSCNNLNKKTKVFINGCWVGVTDTPVELYNDIHDKKCKGIINIYTSVVLDYKALEIRVCNDGGRLTRPVLRVRNNKALLTPDILKRIETKELTWNDLLTNCRIPESVIEYIDPEEQNYAVIAMKMKNDYLQGTHLNYTHCEIHPSTVFGVLASCIPYPEHNQAPRNTYQCLHPDTPVWMSSGVTKAIRDVNIGESVLSFHPDTLEVTSTRVVNQFVRPNDFPIHRLTTISGREIVATEDHKFMTDLGWKTVGEMKMNSSIRVGITMSNYTFNKPNIETSGLILDTDGFIAKMKSLNIDETTNRKTNKVQQYAITLQGLNMLPLSNDNINLSILSRIIGFLYADGSINIYSKNRNDKYNYKEFQCSFDFGQRNDAIQFNNDVANCGFGRVKIMEGTRTFTAGDSDRQQTHHTFTCIYNGCFPAFLISLGIGFGKKTETERNPIPQWIMETPEYGRQFLKGFQGGDGCKISWFKTVDNRLKNNTVYLIRTANTVQHIHPDHSSSLIHFMNQCSTILNNNNIQTTGDVKTSVVSNERTSVSYTISSNHANLIRYFDTIGYAYAETKTCKSFQIVEYLKTKNHLTDETFPEFDEWSNTSVSTKNGFMFVPIHSITHEENGFVSDIEVESDNHSFIASQFASSNCAMGKQAMGIYATNFDKRMDKTAYMLTYPSRPLVDTRLMNLIKLNTVPSGTQIHVAIMSYTGYNQEDSVLVNKGSIDRGLFSTTIYHTEKDEDKNIIRDEIIRCKPNPAKTKGVKFGNYDKLNTQGFIPENTLVENRDVIIAKIVPIKENRNDPTKIIKYEDQSKTFRTNEETYIDKNFTGRNGDGYNFAKVRIRTLRKPVLGDKVSSRHGQKGTVGNIIPECDMPFTKDGHRPDIIINPHAIPSRMTIGQLKETLLGKVLLELGMFGDGTSFGNLDVKTIADELQKLGYESYGNEVLYDGLSGQQMETNIFIGPVFYQRLKHMVSDKQHSRSIGPMVNLTRQPAEGRSRDGGFRIGEMERDVMLSHGISRFCRERLYEVSDKYSAYVCKKCGMIAAYNDGSKKAFVRDDFTIHLCRTCNNTTDFARVEIPYSYKLMSQELQTINVVPRLLTE